jgi:hypothetical protein
LKAIESLLKLQADHRLTQSCMSSLFDILKKLLPPSNVLPKYKYCPRILENEEKNEISNNNEYCKIIHACKNDCILYINQYENKQECPECKQPRFDTDKKACKVYYY